jgi:hypothetical protein
MRLCGVSKDFFALDLALVFCLNARSTVAGASVQHDLSSGEAGVARSANAQRPNRGQKKLFDKPQ